MSQQQSSQPAEGTTIIDALLQPFMPLVRIGGWEGIGIWGAPGKGKTFLVIDPLIRSSLEQGFPTQFGQ